MKSTLLTFLLALSLMVCKAQETRPGPQLPPETGEKFKVGIAGYTFVKFDLDKTLETLKALDVHYLCIKDFHLPMNSTDAEIAAFHEKLEVTKAQLIVRKGFHRDVDSYSGFLEADRTTTTGLAGYLKEKGLRELYVCGLATDFCVGWTALDARATGFEVAVIEDACRAIDLEGSLARAWRDMADAGVRRLSSAQCLPT